MGTGFSKKKKQAKLLQQQFSKLQDQMQHSEYTGSAGNGLVTLTLTGDGEMKQIKIKPDCVDPDDVEGLEALIKAAYQDAQNKIKEQGMPSMPGLPMDLQGLGGLGHFG